MGLKDYSAIYKGDVRIIAAYRGETQVYDANIEPTAPGAFASGAWYQDSRSDFESFPPVC